MSTITIRNLDPETKRRLRMRAAATGRSMEEEARVILRSELSTHPTEASDAYTQIRRLVEPIGGVDIPLPDRESMRQPPGFEA